MSESTNKPVDYQPSLSLPKGGGAIRGIDEKFAAAIATGTAQYSIPIAATPGRAEFQLGLSLSYDSGAGNGPFGLGWQLSAGAITRKTNRGLPTYTDQDVFVLSGGADLIPVEDLTREIDGQQYTVRRYQPRIEGSFARIERYTSDDGSTHWRVCDRGNGLRIYGLNSSARIADPAHPDHVFSWLLSEVRDDRGHIARYSYVSEDGQNVVQSIAESHRLIGGALAPQSMRYLKRIEYGNRQPHIAQEFLFELVFDYGDHNQAWPVRPDAFSTYRAGFEQRTYRLCQRTLMFHHFDELGDEPVLVRSTDFTYEQGPAFSYLVEATQRAYGADGTVESLPPLSFEYQRPHFVFKPGTLESEDATGGIGHGPAQFVDLDGDGLPGILRRTPFAWRYQRNLGQARFTERDVLPTQPNTPSGQLGDLDGDGRLEWVQRQGPIAGFFRRNDKGWQPFTPFTSQPRINWDDPTLRMVDLTGDGHADLLLTERSVFRWHQSLGAKGYGPEHRINLDSEQGPALIFADQTQSIFLADMSGDGLADLVRIHSDALYYWPNLGYGRFGARITMGNVPSFAPRHLFDPRRVRLIDVDGSGTADVIYLGSTTTLYTNEAGNTFSAGISVPHLPPMTGLDSVDAIDLLGNGTACLVWSSPLPGGSVRYVDLLDSKKPHLLIGIRNHTGGERRLSYTPSTRFFLEDQAAGKPWASHLPFPVWVLSRVEQIDHIAKTHFTQTYRYADGHYDGDEREFAGFGWVEQTDVEAIEGQSLGEHQTGEARLSQPPVITRTWLHIGTDRGPPPNLPDGLSTKARREARRALRGQPFRTEIYATDQGESPVQQVEYHYQIRQLQAPNATQNGVFLSLTEQVITRHHEQNPDDPRITHSLVLHSDIYGQPTRQCEVDYGRLQPDLTLPIEVQDAQTRAHVMLTELDYTTDLGTDHSYRLRVPYAERSFELIGTEAPWTLDSLRIAADTASPITYLAEAVPNTLSKRLLSHTRTQFLSNALEPLPWGIWDTLGLAYRQETLQFTPELLAEFGDQVSATELTAAGYLLDGENWWLPSGTAVYADSPQDNFYQAIGTRDALGLEVHTERDAYHLLPLREYVIGADWATSRLEYDYRLMQPTLHEDQNQNQTAARYDSFGRLLAVAQMGKGEGDTLDDPTAYFVYETHNWLNHETPNRVRAFAREEHGANNTRWQETVAYTDGSGNAALTKTRTRPTEANGPARWIGSGRTILNNKGNPVRQYEPYFSDNDHYEDAATIRELGTSPTLIYDALGRVLRIEHPDGTFERIERGAWSQTEHDVSDTVLESDWYQAHGAPDPNGPEPNDPHQRAAWLSAQHANTPTTTHFDALARPIYVVGLLEDGTEQTSRVQIDSAGRYTRTYDALGRLMSETLQGFGIPIYQDTAEAGRSQQFSNVLGQPVLHFDEHDRHGRFDYDALHRPISRTLNGRQIEATLYGERHPNAIAHNLLGQAYQQFDEAQTTRVEQLDMDGNPTHIKRQLIADYQGNTNYQNIPWDADLNAIQNAIAPLLDPEVYTTTAQYDALSRAVTQTAPDGAVTSYLYSESGALKTMTLRTADGQERTVLADQRYDAKGQRLRAEYGNQTEVNYHYDPNTYALSSLNTQTPNGGALQALSYTRDAAGRIIQITDSAQQTLFFNNAVVSATQQFSYDALGRLTQATGRERADNNAIFANIPHANDAQQVRNYTQQYQYDLVGNILQMQHIAVGGGWSKQYSYGYQADGNNRTNRLLNTQTGQDLRAYTYDARGNTLTTPSLNMIWDSLDRLQRIDHPDGGQTHYVYDGGGNRTRKLTVTAQGLIKERRCLGSYEVYREYREGQPVKIARSTHRFADEAGVYLQVDTKTIDTQGADVDNPLEVPLLRYQLGNHQGSAVLVCDENGQVVTYEELRPYGSLAYRAGKAAELSLKRYRFTGKERDGESGLDYFGARYYASWLGRWMSCDPSGFVDGRNLYRYCRNDPVGHVDPDGRKCGRNWRHCATTGQVNRAVSGRGFWNRVREKAIPALAVGNSFRKAATVATFAAVAVTSGGAGLALAESGLAAGGFWGTAGAVTGTMMVGSGVAQVTGVVIGTAVEDSAGKPGFGVEIFGAAALGETPGTLLGAAVGGAITGNKNGAYAGALVGGLTEGAVQFARQWGQRSSAQINRALAEGGVGQPEWTDYLPAAIERNAATRKPYSHVGDDFVMVDDGSSSSAAQSQASKGAGTPLKRMHPDSTLDSKTLEGFRKLDNDGIVESLLKPGREKLTIRPDGTVLQGNHRIKVLEERGFDTSKLFDKADVRVKESLAPWE